MSVAVTDYTPAIYGLIAFVAVITAGLFMCWRNQDLPPEKSQEFEMNLDAWILVKDIGCQHGQWLDGNFHCDCDSSFIAALAIGARRQRNNDR